MILKKDKILKSRREGTGGFMTFSRIGISYRQGFLESVMRA
jgi:hypothetical protein